MGRKMKPTALKVLSGNPGKRPLPQDEPRPPRKIPAPPQELHGAALAEWQRMSEVLYGLGLLSEMDMAALAGYCAHYARWQEAERQITDGGAVIETIQGNLIQSPWVGIANTSSRLMLKFLAEFGMTPSSRAKVTTSSTQKPAADPLDDL